MKRQEKNQDCSNGDFYTKNTGLSTLMKSTPVCMSTLPCSLWEGPQVKRYLCVSFQLHLASQLMNSKVVLVSQMHNLVLVSGQFLD